MIVFWIIVFGCIFLFVGGNAQDCIDTYPNNWKGKFNGSVSTTVTGQTCMRWQSSRHRDYGKENYCTTISRDDDSANGPWCYTSYDDWEYCFVPLCNKDCISSEDDTNGVFYRGSISVTFNGSSCVQWSAAGAYINQDKNHCRNPDSSKKPWCYIVEKQRIWVYCDIPSCGSIQSTICPDLNYSALMVEPTVLTGYRYNAEVRFRCKAGYKLFRSDTLRCTIQPTTTYKGHWDKEQPICIPQTTVCNSLPLDVINSYEVPRTDKIYSNETMTLHCKTGFSGESVTVKCQDNGSWQILPCRIITCNRLQENTSVIVYGKSTNIFKFGENVTLSCKPGYSGPQQISTCLEINKWSVSSINCQNVICSSPFLPPHMKPLPQLSFKYQDQIIFECDKGYNIVGSTTLSCLFNGYWNGSVPRCDPVPCPKIRIQNIKKPDLDSRYYYQDTVTIQCDDTYTLNGSSELKCLVNGSWSSPLPVCEYTICNSRNIPDNVHVKTTPNKSSFRLNENVTFFCDSGYFGTSVTSKCDLNNQWTPSPPTCSNKAGSTEGCMSAGVFWTGFGVSFLCFVITLAGVIVYFRRLLKAKESHYEDIKLNRGTNVQRNRDEVYSELQ